MTVLAKKHVCISVTQGTTAAQLQVTTTDDVADCSRNSLLQKPMAGVRMPGVVHPFGQGRQLMPTLFVTST